MGASGGKSGSNSSTSSAFGQILGQIAEQINGEADPSRQLMFKQLQSVLKGDLFGKGSIPLIQSGVQASRQATAGGMESARGALASSGAANSPFAAAILGQIQASGNQATAQVPIQIAQGILGQGAGLVENIGGQALSGLSGAGQLNNSTSGSAYNVGGSGSFSFGPQGSSIGA